MTEVDAVVVGGGPGGAAAAYHLARAGADVRLVDRARFVIAADGVSGRTATLAGLPRDPSAPLAVAARAYYRAEPPVDPVFEACIGIDDGGRWLPGYGWIFPTGDGEANVGAFVIRTARRTPAGRRRSSGGEASARTAF